LETEYQKGAATYQYPQRRILTFVIDIHINHSQDH
jgi:hypothetical protein